MIDNQYITQGERLKKIRLFLGATREEWANELGIRENSYGDFERGRSNFSVKLLVFLYFKDINVNWLLIGEGKMLNSMSNTHENSDLIKLVDELRQQNEAYKVLLKGVL